MDEHVKGVSAGLMLGLEFEGNIVAASAAVRNQSKVCYGTELLDARLCLISTLAFLVTVKNGVAGVTNKSISDRLVLVMTFAQGLPAIETLISEGHYIKAAAVLKQDYEIVARMAEIQAGTARRGVQPHVKHAPTGSQRFYGDLNAVAHPANEHILGDLLSRLESGEARGVGPTPIFNASVARGLYELHVFTLLEVVREMFQLYAEMYPSDLELTRPAMQFFEVACNNLEKAGFEVKKREAKNVRPGDAR